MRSLAIFALVAAALLFSAPSMAQTLGSQNERTYGPKLTSQAPGFHIIDHVIYHTTLDTPELVPAEGMERPTRAFLSVIDQVNEMTLVELRAPTMF